jgi:hypothetical protein
MSKKCVEYVILHKAKNDPQAIAVGNKTTVDHLKF